MRTYPEYKDSSVQWIEEIPKGWDVERLKYFSEVVLSSVDRHILEEERGVSICHYPDVYNNEVINKTTVLPSGTCSESEFEKFQLRTGNILLTKDSESPDDIGVPTFVEEELENTVCGYHLSKITPIRNDVFPKFLYRYIQSNYVCSYFETESNGVTRYGLGKPSIENVSVPLPPLPEQKQISNYLDQKTQQIDDLIQKTEQKIELLKKQLLILVEDVLLNKKIKRVRLKHVVDLDQRPIERNSTETYNKIGMYNWGRGIFKYPDELGSELGDSTFNYIKEGDLLLSGQFSWEGSVSIVKKEHNNCISSHRFHILNGQKNTILNEYLWSYFISQEGHWKLNTNSFGSGGRNRPLNIRRLLNEKIPVPNIETQKKIRNLVFGYNFYEKYTKKKIKLLKEYKQSLISELVTGKRKVVD